MPEKKILMIAFHFPPIAGSSGYLRTLKFASYLPQYGYLPYIVTAHPFMYADKNSKTLTQIPDGIVVKRAYGLDTGRHLSISGKYLSFLAVPDKYTIWILPALLTALKLIYKEKINLIYTTYPIPSTHYIGYLLKKITGITWVADFRDPMWDEYIDTTKLQLKSRIYIEKKTVSASDKIVMTTQGIKDLFLKRYPYLNEKKMQIIPNGYDENDFKHLPKTKVKNRRQIRLIHAGLLDQIDRDPIPFFKSIPLLLKDNKYKNSNITIDFYAPANESFYQAMVDQLGVERVVRIKPRLPYNEILEEMFNSDILLLFQGPSCDAQIPAKLYEYLRIGKPIFALTTEVGDTGKLIKALKAGIIVPIDQPDKIALRLSEWINNINNDINLPTVLPEQIETFSRGFQTKTLVKFMENL